MDRVRRWLLLALASLVTMAQRGKRPTTVLLTIGGYNLRTVIVTMTVTPAPGTKIVRWELDFGDGSAPLIGTGKPPATATHTYATAGTYHIRLMVWDSSNAMATMSVTSEIVAVPVVPSGCDHTAASLTETVVQQMIADAVNGDVCCLPPGSLTWNTTVTVPATKGITLKGAGIGQTVITAGASLPVGRRLFDIQVAPGNAVTKVTDMTLDQGSPADAPTITWAAILVWGHGSDRFRVHHTFIKGFIGSGIAVVHTSLGSAFPNGAELSGLIDHNTFHCNDDDGGCKPVSIFGSPSWDGGTDLAGNLAQGWGAPFARAIELGSSKAIFVEDNIIDFDGDPQDGASDTFGGAQLVFRFNTTDGPAAGNHGLDSAGYRGARWLEVYRNTYALGATSSDCGVTRGGIFYYFDNTCTHPSAPKGFAINLGRARPQTFVAAQGQCDGSSSFDGNQGSGTNTQVAYPSIGTGQDPGWPCADQTGWHFDENVGAGFAAAPNYFFNNSNGVGGQVAVANYNDDAGNLQNYLKHNREFYIGNASFDGAATVGNAATGGVGRGPRSSRPSTCTTGVAWWSTDQGSWNQSGSGEQGVLDKCTATNTWTDNYYEPYIYPHPLQSE